MVSYWSASPNADAVISSFLVPWFICTISSWLPLDSSHSFFAGNTKRTPEWKYFYWHLIWAVVPSASQICSSKWLWTALSHEPLAPSAKSGKRPLLLATVLHRGSPYIDPFSLHLFHPHLRHWILLKFRQSKSPETNLIIQVYEKTIFIWCCLLPCPEDCVSSIWHFLPLGSAQYTDHQNAFREKLPPTFPFL